MRMQDSEELRTEAGKPMLERITQLVNETIASDASLDVAPLSTGEVLEAIDRGNSEGGSNGRHWVLDPIDGTRGYDPFSSLRYLSVSWLMIMVRFSLCRFVRSESEGSRT